MHYLLRWFIVGFFLTIITGCVAAPGEESTGEFLDSSTITAKVKANILNQLGTTGLAVQVKTFKDEVQLSGFVPTVHLKERAGRIASYVDGVRKVRNDIIVRP